MTMELGMRCRRGALVCSMPLLVWGCSAQADDWSTMNESYSVENDRTPAVQQLKQPLSAAFVAAPGGFRRLTQVQYVRTVEMLLGPAAAAVADPPRGLGEGSLSAVAARTLASDPAMIGQWEFTAFDVAKAAMDNPEVLAEQVPCVTQGPVDEDFRKFCYTQVAHRMGFLFWRLPPTEETKSRLTRVAFEGEQEGTNDAERLYFGVMYMLAAILQSPTFLYNYELGTPGTGDNRQLTPFEVASRLSLFLFGRGPTPELLDMASEGELNTPAQVRAYAASVLATPEGREGFDDTMRELWDIERLHNVGKLDSAFTPALVESMAEEARLLWQDVVFDRPRSFLEIMTTEERRIDAELATIYGVAPPANDWDYVDFATAAPDQERAGIFTTPAIMAIHSHPDLNSPTRRGFTVRVDVLCGHINPPPPGVPLDLPPPPPGQTLRQYMETVHAASPVCASCHNLMDNFGFTFEHFDNIGRYVTTDNGQPIDSSFSYTSPLGTAAWSGPREFASFIVNEANLDLLPGPPPQISSVSRCVVDKLYRLSVGSIEDDADEITALEDLDAAFVAGGHSMQDLLADIVSGPAFLQVGPLY